MVLTHLVLFSFFNGAGTAAAQAAAAVPGGVANFAWLKPKRKKGKVLRYSDFESQEAYAQALAAAAVPLARVTEAGTVEGGDELEDDELLLMAVSRILIHDE